MSIIDKLKVWLSLPFAMPGPIALVDWRELLAVVGLVAFGSRLHWRLPTWTRVKSRWLYGIPNWLSNSRIPFLRCEILHKLNVVLEEPARWQSHSHLNDLAKASHFDDLTMDDICVIESGLTVGQVKWLSRLPSSLKEIYRQRMFAAISTGSKIQFGYKAENSPDRYMTEDDGRILLHGKV